MSFPRSSPKTSDGCSKNGKVRPNVPVVARPVAAPPSLLEVTVNGGSAGSEMLSISEATWSGVTGPATASAPLTVKLPIGIPSVESGEVLMPLMKLMVPMR